MNENKFEIQCELANLQKATATLIDKVNLLQKRLSPILNRKPKAEVAKTEHTIRLTEYGEQIFAVNSGLDDLRLVVNDILDRLEI